MFMWSFRALNILAARHTGPPSSSSRAGSGLEEVLRGAQVHVASILPCNRENVQHVLLHIYTYIYMYRCIYIYRYTFVPIYI